MPTAKVDLHHDVRIEHDRETVKSAYRKSVYRVYYGDERVGWIVIPHGYGMPWELHRLTVCHGKVVPVFNRETNVGRPYMRKEDAANAVIEKVDHGDLLPEKTAIFQQGLADREHARRREAENADNLQHNVERAETIAMLEDMLSEVCQGSIALTHERIQALERALGFVTNTPEKPV